VCVCKRERQRERESDIDWHCRYSVPWCWKQTWF